VTDTPRSDDPDRPAPDLASAVASGRGRIDRSRERRVVLGGILASAAFLLLAAGSWISGIPGTSWAALHLALAGSAAVAIGALLPHFTVSLAAVRPAPARWRVLALSLLAAGAMTAVLADSLGASDVAAVGALSFVVGIGVTAGTAFAPPRAGLGRRGGVVEAAYALALAEVAIGVSLAGLDFAGVPVVRDAWVRLKPAHAWLNLVGFAGLVIAATLIHLYPTVLGTRIRATRALLVLVGGIGGGAVLVAAGYALGSDPLGRVGAVLAMVGSAAFLGWGWQTLRSRGRWTTEPAWHALVIGHLTGGIGWLSLGIATASIPVLVDGVRPEAWALDRVVGPLVLGCVVGTLIGAWSHLVPSIGPGDAARHAGQRRLLGRWPVSRLAMLNGGAALVLAGALGALPALVAAGTALVALALIVALALLVRATAGS
jgi:nitrite reductase (NO-forming)